MFSHGYFVTDGFIVTPLALGKGEPLVISYNRWVCRYATNLSDNRRVFPRTTGTGYNRGVCRCTTGPWEGVGHRL